MIVEDNPQVEVMTDNPTLAPTETSSETDLVRAETQALIEAIQTKAFSEAQKAGDFARDSYLEFVRRARVEVERLNLVDRNRIEDAMRHLQWEVDKDWSNVVYEFNHFSDRVNAAARAAWDVLTAR